MTTTRRTTLVFFAFVLQRAWLLTSATEYNWWKGQELGELCKGDNDLVGQHLGCNCDQLVGDSETGTLSADCKEKWIGYNDTMGLPPGLNVSIHVRNLDLSKNFLERVDEGTFGSCEGLYKLSLYRNQITSVSGLSCQRLQSLDLSWNHLTNISSKAFQHLPQLTNLDLSHNHLIFVAPHALDRLQRLQSLNLNSNPLGMELNFFQDYLLSLNNLKYLEELDLGNTTLPDFPLSLVNGTRNVRILHLNNNLISRLPENVLHEMTCLEELDLSGNWLQTLPPYGFQGLSALRKLVLDRMPELSRIEKHAFAGLESLRELSCQHNHYLSSIDVLAFKVSEELHREGDAGDCHPIIIRLGDCDLSTLEYGTLPWSHLEVLELRRNPWRCDCGLQWAAKMHRDRPADAAILADSDFSCRVPHIFAGVPVVNVDPAEMLCGSEAATIIGTVVILVFGVLLFTFCTVVVLNHMGMLPNWVRQYNLFNSGSSLPAYTRVNPKPNRPQPPHGGEMEWDHASDIGNGT